MFLPLLPATPFLILAAACFVRSSDRLHRYLFNHRVFGPYIRNYREHRAMGRTTRAVTLAVLWGSLGVTALGFSSSLPVRFLLLAVGIGVTLHLVRLRRPPDPCDGEASGAIISPGIERTPRKNNE